MPLFVALAWPASAAPPSAEPLTTEPVVHRVSRDKVSFTFESFKVVDGPAPLRAALNDLIHKTAGIEDARATAYEGARDADVAEAVVEGACLPGLITRHVASWRCGAGALNLMREYKEYDGGGGTMHHPWRVARYAVDGLSLRPMAITELFKNGVDVVAVLTAITRKRFSDAMVERLVLTEEGLEFDDDGDGGKLSEPVVAPFAALRPHLKPGSPWDGLDADDETLVAGSAERAAMPADERFAISGQTVSDKVSGLVWRQTDNGADLTWDAAAAWCRGLGAGPGGPWRLPRPSELEVLVDGAARHKPKDVARDCAKGKYAYAIPQVFDVSCGILWTDSRSGASAADRGLVSGKARTAKVGDAKNHRALCVSGQ